MKNTNKNIISRMLSRLVIVTLLVNIAATPTQAALVFTNDLFKNEADRFRIGQGSDTDSANLTLEFGNTNMETLGWVTGADLFNFSDTVTIGGSSETLSNAGFTLDDNDLFVAGQLGVESDIFTDGDFFVGNIGLNDVGTNNVTSGASLIGAFDEFANTDATTVQAILNDFDDDISASEFTNYDEQYTNAIADTDTTLDIHNATFPVIFNVNSDGSGAAFQIARQGGTIADFTTAGAISLTPTSGQDLTFTTAGAGGDVLVSSENWSVGASGDLRVGEGHFRSAAFSVLTGSIDPNGTTTITGVGTQFTTELEVGDAIVVNGELAVVVDIASATSLTTDIAISDDVNDPAPVKLPAGIAIQDSADAPLLTSGEGGFFRNYVDSNTFLYGQTDVFGDVVGIQAGASTFSTYDGGVYMQSDSDSFINLAGDDIILQSATPGAEHSIELNIGTGDNQIILDSAGFGSQAILINTTGGAGGDIVIDSDDNIDITADSAAGIFNLNASSGTAVTNIATGTTTGAVTIGGGSGTVAVNSTSWDISTTGAASGFTTLGLTGDITMYDAVNDGNPQVRVGATDAEELHIQTVYDTGAQTLDRVDFVTDAASGTANKGLFRFNVDGTDIVDINDTGLNIASNGATSGLYVGGTAIITDGATTFLRNIDSLDTTTENTIDGQIFDADAENITGVWEVQDNVAFQFGNDGDVLVQYDETTDDRLEITGTNANVFMEDNLAVGSDIDVVDNLTAGDIIIDEAAGVLSFTGATSASITSAAALTIGDGGDPLNVNGTTGNWDLTDLDFDIAGNASEFTLAANSAADDLTIEVTGAFDSSLILQSAGTGADAVDINATGTGGGITVNTTDGALALTTAGATNGDITFSAADVFDVDAVDALSLNSSAGVINIGNDAVAQNLNLGTGGARTVAIGSTTASTITLDADGLIDLDSDDGGITITASDAGNSDDDNIVLIAGNNTPNAGEAGNDIALEAEDDIALFANGGVVLNGGVVFLNVSAGTQTTSIGTGTTTGAVSIGGGSNTVAVNSTSWDIDTAGAASGFTTIGASGNITTSGGDFVVGSIGLNDFNDNAAQDGGNGADLIGADDDVLPNLGAFTTVQGAIVAVDTALGLFGAPTFDDVYTNSITDTDEILDLHSAGDTFIINTNSDGSGAAFQVSNQGGTVADFATAGRVGFSPLSGQEFDITTAGAGNIDLNAGGTGVVTVDTADGSISLTAVGATAGDISLAAGDDITVNASSSAGIFNVNVDNGSAATNIGTGTTTGAINISGGASAVTINSNVWDISASGAASSFTTLGLTGDITMYDAVNDGNPQIRVGAADAEEAHFQAVYDSGAQTLDYALFTTDVASAGADQGMYRFNVDGTDILDIDDGGINFAASRGISIAGTDIITDAAGTATLSNIDALEATTENTVEGAIFDNDTENITGVWEVQDNVAFQFGNDGDVLVQYDETTDDRLEITGTNANVFMEDNLAVGSDIDVVDNLTAGDIIIDEAAGVLSFTGATSASIITTNAAVNALTIGGSGGTNNENLTLDFDTTSNAILVGTGTGVTTWDYGTINLETDTLDVSEGNITNAGDVQLDSLTADDGTTIVANDNLQFTTGLALQTGTADTNTLLLQARDVDGAAWTTFGTLTAGNTPTMTLSNVTSSTNFNPTSSDGGQLGTGTLMWSDLFLASGSVINLNNGDVTLTHAANSLAVDGGDLSTTDTFDINAGGDLTVGTTAETLANASFALDGNDAFVEGTLGVEGDIYTDGTLVVGNTSLSEATAANDSGAFLVGAFDEFGFSASTNVQDVLDDLDAAIALIGAPSLDDAYNNDTGERTIVVDDGDVSWDMTAAGNDFIVDLQNSGAFQVQDGSANVLEITGAGAANITPTSGQNFGITTAGAGDITLTSADAITVAGTTSINASNGTAVTNIGTGTTTGAVTIGGGSGTVAINSSDWDIATDGAITGVSFDANGSGNSISNIDNADLTNDTVDWDKISDSMSLDAATTIAIGAGEGITNNKTFTDGSPEDGEVWNFTGLDTGGTTNGQRGLVLNNVSSTEAIDNLLVLDNLDTDDTVNAAILISNPTRFGNLFNIGGTFISQSEFTILDAGIDLNELDDTGTLTASTVDINGGAIDGTTIGATTPSTGAFTTLSSTGATTIGNNSATVAINSSDWDIATDGTITGVAFDANGTGNSLSNVENADLAANTLDWDRISNTTSLDADTSIAVGAAEEITTNKTFTNNTGENGEVWNFTASDTGAATTTQHGILLNNAASTEGVDALLALDNADSDDNVVSAIKVLNAARFDNIFDIGGTLISASELGGLDGGYNFEEVYAADGDGILTASANFATSVTGTTLMDTAGVFEINSSGAAISIGNDAVAQAINIGTGAAARTITVGNATGATAVNLNSGTGGVVISSTGTAANALDIDVTGTAGGIDIDTTDGGFTLNAGGATNGDITLTSTDDFSIFTGSGNVFTLNTNSGSATTNIATGTTTGTVTIGGGSNALVGNVNDLDIDIANNASEITLTANGAADDLTIGVVGNTNSSLILQSEGSGADALAIQTLTNGGDIDINSNDRILINSNGATTSVVSINTSNSGAITNIGTGTTTGAVNIGGNSNTVDINSSDWDISATGVITGVDFDVEGTGNSASNIDFDNMKNSMTLDANTSINSTLYDFAIVKTMVDATADAAFEVDATGLDTTSGTTNQRGVIIDNVDGLYPVDKLFMLRNQDTDQAVTTAFEINSAGGGFTNLFDVMGILITPTEFNLIDGGVSFEEVYAADGDGILTASANFATSVTGTTLMDTAGVFEINSSGAAISIGNDAVAQNLNLGTAGARSIVVGSTSATTATIDADGLIDLDSDDGSITLTASDAGNAGDDNIVINAGNAPASSQPADGNDIILGAEGDIGLLANGSINMRADNGGNAYINFNATTAQTYVGADGTTGSIHIGGFGTQTLNIGNGAGAKTVNLGSATGASATVINAGTGDLSLTSADTIAINSADWDISTTGDMTNIGSIGLNGDITMYDAVNDGNPQIRVGAADAEEVHVQAIYDTGAQTLDYALFTTDVASAGADQGMYRFNVDGTDILDIDDGGINFAASRGISIAGTDILTDSAGTATLSNIDAIDATTEDSIEATIFDADAQNVTGVWEVQDNVAFQFGNDADVLVQYDETTDDRLEITGANANVYIEDNLFANSDIDVVDNITAGDVIIDEAAGVLSFTGATSASITSATALTIGDGGDPLDLNATTGNWDFTDLDFDIAGNTSEFTLAANSAADDLTIEVTGAFDSSLILQSAGTGADALSLITSNAAGDISITSGDDITVNASSSAGIFNLNASNGTAVTNIGTGTTTGAVTIGGNSNTVAVASTGWDITTAGQADFGGAISSADTFDINAGGDLTVGTTTETISNASFTFSGNDAFIEDSLGVEGAIYSDTYSDKYIWLQPGSAARTQAALGTVGSNHVAIISFDETNSSNAVWNFPVPEDANPNADMIVTVFWTPEDGNGADDNVRFTMDYESFGVNDIIGTAPTDFTNDFEDQAPSNSTLKVTATTGGLVIADASANIDLGDIITIDLGRDAADSNDTYGDDNGGADPGDIRILGVRITYQGKKLQ